MPVLQTPQLVKVDRVGRGRENLDRIEARLGGDAASRAEVVPKDKRAAPRLRNEADGNRRADHASSPTSITALITPDSGRTYASKLSITASNAVRCVIHGLVSIVPSSISPMMRLKSRGKALPRALDGHLGPVQMQERNRLRGNADVNERAGMRHVLQRGAHRAVAAGGVGNHSVHVAACRLAHLLALAAAFEDDRMLDSVALAAKGEPRLDHVHDRNSGAGQPRELERRQADRAGADNQNAVVFPGAAAVGCVAADAQRFHQRKLLERELRRGMQLFRADQKPVAQAAVDHHADDFKRFAAVRGAAAAGKAGAAIHVRLDAAAVAGPHVGDALAHRENRDPELVAGNPRIAEKRHLAQIPAVIGPANAHALGAHQRLPRPGRPRFVDLDVFEMLRLHESNRSHRLPLLLAA